MTTASDGVSMALKKAGVPKKFLAESWNMSQNAVYNKFIRNSWSAKDLAKVSALIGCKLALVFPDGQQIYIDAVTDAED